MLYFKKRRDNQFERMYYTYLLMRHNGNVYPTNTLNIKINENSFNGNSVNNNLSLPPGTIFYYYNHGSNTINDYATTVPPEYVTDKDDEEYPYDITINEDGDYVRVFKYIEEVCPYPPSAISFSALLSASSKFFDLYIASTGESFS